MSSPLRLKSLLENLPFILAVAALVAGCRSEFDHRAVDVSGEIARASKLGQPIVLLVTESGASRADDQARALFEKLTVKNKKENIAPVVLDLSVSRNRAEAARFHVTNTPALFCLSPRGLIVTRDQPPITKELLRERIGNMARRAPELDAKLAALEAAAANNGHDDEAQMELADFLLARQNDREAIPPLTLVARSESADTSRRVHAWVALARAHYWIGEAEKGRHEAEDLIATLGPQTAEARAGGNLVLGTQDAIAKRVAAARRELEAAIVAAPESDYARQAAEELAKLPGEGK